MTFQFVNTSVHQAFANSFVIRIPVGIKTKQQLLSTFKKLGEFPNYFGENWDALHDCLCDVSWIAQQVIMIIHEDLPLHENPTECKIYLETVVSQRSSEEIELI
jgi:RNAse (barnase) inhibitor barstar